MALKATIFKAAIQLADMDRNIYQDINITIARHPSETDERMMVRVLAFCLQLDEGLEFTKGLSSDDEPDLWLKNLSGETQLWIDLGQPDEKRIRKACNRARQVVIYSYGGNATKTWWQQNQAKLSRYDNLTVVSLDKEVTQSLAQLAQRNMVLQCTVQDGQIWLSSVDDAVLLEPEFLLAS
ncbi:MAG: YaeQ family protein [Spongiibacteraceae bacterium]